MKIGILTFNNTTNYGAFLQAYALQNVVEKISGNVEIIDYESPNISRYYLIDMLSKQKGIRKLKNKLITIPFCNKKIRYFEEFEKKHLKLSIKYRPTNIEEMWNAYDCIITGSDQVFNLNLTIDDRVYLLDTDKELKKISYAASLGNFDYNHLVHSAKETLESFDYLSIREENDATNLSRELNRQVEYVVDPTLLLSQKDWENIEEEIDCPCNYIFAYLVSPCKEYLIKVNEIAKKLKKKVVYIPYNSMDYHKGIINKTKVNPGQFLYLIHNADLVITNSFHGTILSLNYRKQFVVLFKTENNRVRSILSNLSLERNMLNVHDTYFNHEIDYSYAETVLSSLKEHSINYLKNALED